MTIKIPALSSEARRSVWIGCAAITLASVAASGVVTYLVSLAFDLGADVPAYLVAGLIPMMLAGPASYFQLKRLEQVKDAYRKLERAGKTDALTGTLSRQAFIDTAAAATPIGRPGALLVVDIDNLKSINDRLGHQSGDAAIRSVAEAIGRNVSSSDVVGRLGGGEFGVYLRVATDRHASALAEAIRKSVEKAASGRAALTVTIGAAATSEPVSFSDLLGLANRQLQAAKASGPNRIAITALETGSEDLAAA